MQPNPELADPTPIFTREDMLECCQLILKPTLCEDYLTQMSHTLRQYRYQCKLDLRTNYLVEGLRYEYGVDRSIDQQQADSYYSMAQREYSVIGCSKLIERELQKQTEEGASDLKPSRYDQLAYRWILSGCTIFDDTRIDIWDDILKEKSKLVEKIERLLKCKALNHPQDIDVKFMIGFFETKRKQTPAEIVVPMDKLRELAMEKEHMPSAHYLLYLLYYARLSNQLMHMMEQSEDYIRLIKKHRYYHAYADCARTFNKLRRINQTMELLREGAANGYEPCLGWLLCGIYSYEYSQPSALRQVMNIYSILCLLQNNHWYEFLYSRILTRKGYFDKQAAPIENRYAELEEQFVQIILNRNQSPGSAKLVDEFALLLVYYLQDLPLQVKNELMTDLVKRSITEDKNQRLYMCYLMKIRRKIVRQAEKQQDEACIVASRVELNDCESDFLKFCLERGNNTDSSTAFFRLGRCYAKGYGTPVDIKKAFLLYCKSLEQIALKHQIAFNTSVTIYHCRQRCLKALKVMLREKAVIDFMQVVRKKTHEQGTCSICMESGQDAILFPCEHLTCTVCYNEYRKAGEACPLCRGKILACLSLKWVLECSEMLVKIEMGVNS